MGSRMARAIFVACSAAKGGVTKVDGVLLRGYCFYRNHLYVVIRRDFLAFDLDLLTLVTSQRAGICD